MMASHFILSIIAAIVCVVAHSSGQCVSMPRLAADLNPLPPDSCCQHIVCNIPCAKHVPSPARAFGVAVIISIVLSFVVGVFTLMCIKRRADNFFVAGRTLPLYVAVITLSSQSIDSNALLSNASLSFRFHFFDGAVIPIGLGLSLILNAIFFAAKINRDHVLTLPDVFAKRYGRTMECLVSLATILSFLFLLTGNLVGLGMILSYVLDIKSSFAIWIAISVVWVYTTLGGLFSVAYTDLMQSSIGWVGCIMCAVWFIHNIKPGAAPPSRGFPGYIYPDKLGDGGVCDTYSGVQCFRNSSKCCFNPVSNATDNGAFPFGDQHLFGKQMFSPNALTPFPNALLWNWATIFILGFGNLADLGLQARCMASRTPRVATMGCIIGGFLTFLVGNLFAYLGGITRVFYGPDSIFAQFNPDSCSTLRGLPSCAEWVPGKLAFPQLLTQNAPPVLGAWCLIGLVAASMSTCDGALLAMATVFSNNLLWQIAPTLSRRRLLLRTRLSTLPFAIVGGFFASSRVEIATTLVILASDVVLATVVVPLFGCFYAKKPSARAALLSFVAGAVLRIVLQFVLDKDGSFLLPYSTDQFMKFGPAASLKAPLFVNGTAESVWDPAVESCTQKRFRDYSGVDSLTAFAVSVLVFVGVQMIERYSGPLFSFPGDTPYEKNARRERTIHRTRKENLEMESGVETEAAKEMKVTSSDAVNLEL